MREKMEYTITFTEPEPNAILNSIQELPAKVANPLTQKIRDQAAAQQAAEAEPAAE